MEVILKKKVYVMQDWIWFTNRLLVCEHRYLSTHTACGQFVKP